MCYYNGQQYNSDTARIINKFDVYICDLGECDDSSASLGKKRPCVIISSDNVINPKSYKYHVAPIRTEHNTKVSKETLDDIVKSKRDIGRIYIPLESNPGEYRFIDITDIRPVSVKDIYAYKYSIINSETKLKINKAIIKYFLSNGEFESVIGDNLHDMEAFRYITAPREDITKAICTHHDINGESTLRHINDGTVVCSICGSSFEDEKHVFFDKKDDKKEEYIRVPKYKRTKLPIGFTKYAELHSRGKMTIKEICDKVHKSPATVTRYLRIVKEQNG